MVVAVVIVEVAAVTICGVLSGEFEVVVVVVGGSSGGSCGSDGRNIRE